MGWRVFLCLEVKAQGWATIVLCLSLNSAAPVAIPDGPKKFFSAPACWCWYSCRRDQFDPFEAKAGTNMKKRGGEEIQKRQRLSGCRGRGRGTFFSSLFGGGKRYSLSLWIGTMGKIARCYAHTHLQ